MDFIDDMARVAKTNSEDDDKEDDDHSPKASVDEPIVEQTYPTRNLTIKSNEMLTKAFEMGMFLTKDTEFFLDNHFETMGTSKIFPVYFRQGPDQPKLNTCVALLRATDLNGTHFEVTNG